MLLTHEPRRPIKIVPFVTATCLLIASTVTAAHAASRWPQFRGPDGRGVAETEKPPVTFGPSANVLWKTALPSGHSSPCIWDDRIFVTAFDRERKKLETRS